MEKKIASLSMGEKARVAFAKLVLSGANLLLLDEPTNYLDINSREKMEEVLADFQGASSYPTTATSSTNWPRR